LCRTLAAHCAGRRNGDLRSSRQPRFSGFVVSKGITIRGITGRRLWETWDLGVSLVSSGKVDLKKVITHQFDFKDYEAAFSAMMSGNSGKVVLNVSQ